MKFALIDLGSNSSRMYLLEEEEDGSIRILTRERVMTRPSEGMGDAQRIREDAAARTAAVLKKFHTMAEDAGAKILAVATAAVRKAKNGAAFCERVERETGIRLNVISGQLEAFFDFQGVLAGLPQQKDALICDTGGGSTELILVRNGRIGGRISLPFGAMSLTDRFLREGDLAENAARVKEALAKAWDGVPFLKEAVGLSLIGLGGSAVALPAIDRILSQNKTAAFSPHGYVKTYERDRPRTDDAHPARADAGAWRGAGARGHHTGRRTAGIYADGRILTAADGCLHHRTARGHFEGAAKRGGQRGILGSYGVF